MEGNEDDGEARRSSLWLGRGGKIRERERMRESKREREREKWGL